MSNRASGMLLDDVDFDDGYNYNVFDNEGNLVGANPYGENPVNGGGAEQYRLEEEEEGEEEDDEVAPRPQGRRRRPRASWAGREGISKLLIRKIVKRLGMFRLSNGAKESLVGQGIAYVDNIINMVVNTAAEVGSPLDEMLEEDVYGAVVTYERGL